MLAPLALVLAFEMGRQVFRSSWLAFATMLAQVGMIALAPGGGGAYTSLELPGTTARQLLVPAAIALFFRFVREPVVARLRSRSPSPGMDLAFVHPTYALFLAHPARRLRARARARHAAPICARAPAALVAFGVPVLARLRVARADRRRDALAQPGRGRAGAGVQHVRDRSRRQLAVELSPRARPRRAHRRDRDRRARARPARRARRAAALERVRARRHGARARARALVVPLPALLRPRLALAVAARRRASSRSPSRSRAAPRCWRARCGVLVLPVALAAGIVLAARVPGRLRRGGSRTAGRALADVDRALGRPRRHRRRRSCSRRRGTRPYERAGLARRACAVAALRPAGRRARLRALGRGPRSATRTRSRPGSSSSSATHVPSAPSSSPISRRATASLRTRRSTSRTRRRRTSPTRRRTILTRRRADCCGSSGTGEPRDPARATAPAGSCCAADERVRPGAAPRLP